MNTQDIQNELERLLEAGDTKAFEDFVVEHFTELPEAAQRAALMHFTKETLEARMAGASVETLRAQGLAALAELQAAKETLKDGNR